MSRERAKERACDNAILKTLAYRAIFKYPLSFYQLSTFLITNREFDFEFLTTSLKRLIKKNKVKIIDGKFIFPGIKPLSWERRFKDTKNMLNEYKIVFKVLGGVPWVKMVGVTGSVAAYNADREADMDIFIISQKGRLWLTRGFCLLFLKLLRKYPKKGHEKGKICPNLLIDETKLEWPREKHSIFTAHEVCMMQPVYNKDNTYLKFLHSNEWAFANFKNYKVDLTKKLVTHTLRTSKLVDLLEKWAMKMQYNYMKKKMTGEIVQKSFIHFNKNDNAPEILNTYGQYLKKMERD